MAKEVIALKDPIVQAVLKDAIGRENGVLSLAIVQAQHKIEGFERKYGPLDRERLYGKVDDVELVEWEGEQETLARLKARLQCLEDLQVESR